MKKIFCVAALALVGCAATSRPVEVGPDRYQVSAMAAPARGGIAGAQQHATEAAADYCRSLGKHSTVMGVETGHEFPVNGTATVTFECH